MSIDVGGGASEGALGGGLYFFSCFFSRSNFDNFNDNEHYFNTIMVHITANHAIQVLFLLGLATNVNNFKHFIIKMNHTNSETLIRTNATINLFSGNKHH